MQSIPTELLNDKASFSSRICPLLAQSDKQQELFYLIFNEWWEYEVHHDDGSQPDFKPTWWLALGLLFILLSVYGIWVLLNPVATVRKFKAEMYVKSCQQLEDSVSFSYNLIMLEQEVSSWSLSPNSIIPVNFRIDEAEQVKWEFGDGQIDTINTNPKHVYAKVGYYHTRLIVAMANFQDTVEHTIYVQDQEPISAEFDTLRLSLRAFQFIPKNINEDARYTWNFGDESTSRLFKPTHLYQDASNYTAQLKVHSKEDSLGLCLSSSSMAINTVEEFEPLAFIDPIYDNTEGQLAWTGLGRWGGAGLAALPFLLLMSFGLWMMRRDKSKKEIEEAIFEERIPLEKGKELPLEIPFPDQSHLIVSGPALYQLAKALRQRRAGERRFLNVPATIEASSRQAGMPTLHYASKEIASEYLILINQHHSKDHQAALFLQLMQLLKAEEVPVEIFTYHEDPRYVFRDGHPDSIHITSLYKKYPKHRLIVFGKGDGLMQEIEAALQPWVKEAFEQWDETAWVTPVPPFNWGKREELLYQYFTLFPAAMEDQIDLVEAISEKEPLDFRSLRKQLRRESDVDMIPPSIDFYDAGHLEGWLGEEHFRWLAASVLYPYPNWDVTVRMGKALGIMSEDGELSEPGYKSLLKLSQIPWLQDGNLSATLRNELLSSLSEKDEAIGRTALVDMLKHAPTSPSSYAHQEKASQLVLNEAILQPEDIEKQKELARLLGNDVLDTVMQARLKVAQANKQEEKSKIEDDKKSSRWLTILPLVFSGLLMAMPILWLLYTWVWKVPVGERWQRMAFVQPVPDVASELNAQGIVALENQQFEKAKGLFQQAFETRQVGNMNVIADSANIALGWANYPPAAYNYTVSDYQKANVYYDQQIWDSADIFLNQAIKGFLPAEVRESEFISQGLLDSTNFEYLQAAALNLYNQSKLPELYAALTDIKSKYPQFVLLPSLEAQLNIPFKLVAIGDTAIITNPGLRTGNIAFRSRPLTKNERNVVNQCLQNPRSPYCKEKTAIDNQTLLGTLKAGEQVILLGMKDEHFFVQVVNLKERGYISAKFNGEYTLAPKNHRTNSQYNNPDPGKADYDRGVQFYRKKDYQLAEKYLESYISQNPEGEFIQEARDLLQKAIEQQKANNVEQQLNQELIPNTVEEKNTTVPDQIPIPKVVLVKGGSFLMGSEGGEEFELPIHEVYLDNFRIGETEVTNAQYAAFLNNAKQLKVDRSGLPLQWIDLRFGAAKIEVKNYQEFVPIKGYENHPVTYVDHEGAIAYCIWLSSYTGENYRLPTEAEWEYAANGGFDGYSKDLTPRYVFAGAKNTKELDQYAWTANNAKEAMEVGKLKPNLLGSFDMTGNIQEWVSDTYGTYSEGKVPQRNPQGPDFGSHKVIRGGAAGITPYRCRNTARSFEKPSFRSNLVGFRVAKNP